MSLNGEVESAEDSVICLDISQDSESNNDTSIEDSPQINSGKTLPPASESIIILDDSINLGNEITISKNVGEKTKEKEEPLIKVIFQNESVACKYRKRIRDFLRNLLSLNLPEESSHCSDLILSIKESDFKKKCPQESELEDQLLFKFDSTPSKLDRYNVPTYGKRFARVMTESCDDTEGNNDDKAPKLTCFNCLGNHNLRDCPNPKNPMEINKNRKEFMSKSGPRNVRYHLDDQRFTPGSLSVELKKALGLSPDQLPKHILNMRVLGYPPGWLEEAKLQHSGLNLYNSEGCREADPKEELGEIFCPENLTEFDIKKIHDFPGFNVPAPYGTRDAYWCAEQQAIHSKEVMLTMLSRQKAEEGYRRKKLKRSNEVSADAVVEPVQMDIEDLQDTSVESIPINGHIFSSDCPGSPKSPGELSNSPPPDYGKLDISFDVSPKADDSDVMINSPSLAELEKRKKVLLDELNDSNSLSNSSTPNKPITNNTTTEQPSSNEGASTSSDNFNSENILKVGAVKSVELGTPLIDGASIYKKLPSSDKFSKDICDVINFENLPDATGKYEKMSGIIQKIRNTLTPKE